MTLGSLFDGSGGFPLAGALNGLAPLWASEIEPYPIAVTRSRFPEMKPLGSVTEIHGGAIAPVDVVTFGSPCTDMSIAGKRLGMKHTAHGAEETTRSGLFYEAIRIIQEMREATHGKYPQFAVWENVPGAFSSNQGEDFYCVLSEFCKIFGGGYALPAPPNGKWLPAGEILGDGFSLAWRVLDAQYWGVPQRRRRIYLVADFAGERAGKILFEREGVPGDSEPRPAPREGAARDAGGGAEGSRGAGCVTGLYCLHDKATRYRGGGETRGDDGSGNGLGVSDGKTMYTLTAADRHSIAFMAGQSARARGIAAVTNGSPTLKAGPSGTNQAPSVVYPSIARCLTAEADASPCADRGMNVVALDCRNLSGSSVSGTLQAKENGGYSLNYQNPVVYDARGNGDGSTVNILTGDHENRITDYSSVLCMAHGQSNAEIMENRSPTLSCNHEQPIVAATQPRLQRKYIVRRLTPVECARLQGFPDGWGTPDFKASMTDGEAAFWEQTRRTHAAAMGKKYRSCKDRAALLKWYNALHTDSAEYKMWGNGIALPCAAFVLKGVAEAMNHEKGN